MAEATKRYAVVTGANKGIGFEICKQLASKGTIVIVTARDECRGLQALDKLKQELNLAMSYNDNVIFHHLDLTDPNSIASLANFIKTHFGKLDILVNNAGLLTENEELTEACLKTNYYGPKGLTKALIPLLQFSNSPRIVNVSSTMGRLEIIPNGWPKEVLSDVQNLTEEKIDNVVNEFFKDFKEGSLETKGWPLIVSAYSVSKAALSAYTRILAKKYPSICSNAICPGYVKTDINSNTGTLTPYEGAEPIVRLALLPDGSPSGLFFSRYEDKPF
ncbi:(+)-neomenthol dehydrogenase [Trifolium pratense]|uniref:Short-chain dehydrogenase/reductase n=1 Tax=Trifolium pratense TaxID=57577 RepID=A0A2K3LAM1_TRIPR|nr:(+)-neomenthol dehydrogenase-like [Trifolium pratense]PNX75564.1 (+)-neomenthol dehydrogenase [Trifolium pratense]